MALFLLVGSIVFTLGCLEIALRIWMPARPSVAARPPLAPVDLPVVRGVLALARPNVVGRLHNGVFYRTNRFGVRGPDFPERKPPRTFRVLVIGDSVTMGAGVPEEDVYAARIERRLNEDLEAGRPDRRFHVINLGIGGLDAAHIMSRLERRGLRFEPDLIVYGYTLNDIEGPAYRQIDSRETYAAHLERRAALQVGWRLPAFLEARFHSLLELVSPPEKSYRHELDINYFENPEALADLGAHFDRLANAASTRDVCVLLLQHTDLHFLHVFHPFRRHYRVVEDLARARGFFVQETRSYFSGHRPPDLWVSLVDTHPNADGHALLADALWDGLQALPERCWR
jgi:lysophospholipase L1-like esterase